MEKYTDQEFFYKQTPVNYDGIAKFTSIKGNTLVWNQLVENGDFASTSRWSVNNITTYSVANNTLTFSFSSNDGFIGHAGIPLTKNHKYLWLMDFKTDLPSPYRENIKIQNYRNGGWSIANRVSNNNWNTYSTIFTFTEDSATVTAPFFRLVSYTDGAIAISNSNQIRNVQVFDLTQMGLDITDPSEFTSLFSLPYYDYNAGTLLSFNGTGLKTGGENLIDFSTLQIGKNWTKGSAVDRAIIEFDVKENTEYTISIDYSSNVSNSLLVFRDGWNTGQISNIDMSSAKTYTFTTPSTCKVVCVQFNARVSGFVLSSSDFYGFWNCALTDTFSTKALPVSTYFPTGMKSAGSVYDELTESKAITRVGMVDLGTLNWAYSTDTQIFTSGALSQRALTQNGICARYEKIDGWTEFTQSSKSIFLPTNSNIVRIKDSAYSTAEAFTTAMSGVYLYYELATETETDAEDFFYKFYADGTEQLLPVNESSPSTSYLIADIEYYDSTEGDSLYRRFWLINGDGERWDLTDKEFKSFLNNPTGLGFRKTIEITRYGEKANKNNEVYDFPQPSGELLFYDTYNSTRYDKYNKFIRFLMSQPITLYYMIPVSYISGIANIFTLNCDVTEVQKTESKTDHILTSSIVFNGLGFYEGDEISVNGTTDTYTLTNEGDFPVGFEITVEGSLTKPYITLSQDGELYGEAKFVGTDAYNSLYLNSNDGEQNIILQQGGSVIPNPLSYQDLSISNGSIYVTFVKLAKGVSELSIGVESGSITNVNIKYSPKYRSV